MRIVRIQSWPFTKDSHYRTENLKTFANLREYSAFLNLGSRTLADIYTLFVPFWPDTSDLAKSRAVPW